MTLLASLLAKREGREELLASVTDLIKRSTLDDGHKDTLEQMFLFGHHLHLRKDELSRQARPGRQRRTSRRTDDGKASSR